MYVTFQIPHNYVCFWVPWFWKKLFPLKTSGCLLCTSVVVSHFCCLWSLCCISVFQIPLLGCWSSLGIQAAVFLLEPGTRVWFWDYGLLLRKNWIVLRTKKSKPDQNKNTTKPSYHSELAFSWFSVQLVAENWLFSRVLIKSVLTVGACYFDVSASRMWLGTWNCLQGHFLSQTLFSCSCSLENPQKTFPSTNSAHCEGKRCSVTGQSIFLISMAVASAFVTLLSVYLLPK